MIHINNVHDEKIEHEEEAKKYTFKGYALYFYVNLKSPVHCVLSIGSR